MIAIAVMGLVIDAISKRVAVVFGMFSSMLARPKARSYTTRPPSTTMSAPLNCPYSAARVVNRSIAAAAGDWELAADASEVSASVAASRVERIDRQPSIRAPPGEVASRDVTPES
jgi:hypothetical protein